MELCFLNFRFTQVLYFLFFSESENDMVSVVKRRRITVAEQKEKQAAEEKIRKERYFCVFQEIAE